MVSWRLRLRKQAGLFISFAVIAAVLPVLLVGATSPAVLRFLTFADEHESMRLWFEPENVQTVVGQNVEFTLMAEYEDRSRLIPGVQVGIWTTEGLTASSDAVEYASPFSGRVELGKVTVTARTRGEHKLSLIEASVNTTLPDLPVIVGEARITVK